MTGKARRTKMSVRNAVATMVDRGVGLLLSFISRTFFLKLLSAEYLGLGGLFGNVFSVISLCELGFGAAITQSLYKPIAQNDEIQVSRIINYYSKIYKRVCVVSIVLSLAFLPFVPCIATKSIPNIQGIYLLFAFHNCIGYLFAPKRMLLVCDQHQYVVTGIRIVFNILVFVMQTLLLITTKNYVLYLSARIFMLALEGTVTDYVSGKKYAFLKSGIYPDEKYKSRLFVKVKSLLLHKIGANLTHSTDSILISVYLGLESMGKYSNYALVAGSVITLIDIVIGSVSASVGNLSASTDSEKNISVLRRLFYINFALLTLFSCVLLNTLNPFIRLWIGEEYLFNMATVAIIISSFYFSCIRDPVQVFLNAYGIFEKSGYMTLCRAAVNFVLSVLFVKNYGIAGVFLGTAISAATVPLWCEPLFLYKFGFKCSVKPFMREMFFLIGVSFLACAFSFLLCSSLPETFYGILLRSFISAVVAIAAICCVFIGGLKPGKNFNRRL